LPYRELQTLASRLSETSETIRNPAFRADLHQASLAVSDLASIKFGLEEIVGKIIDQAFNRQSEAIAKDKEDLAQFAADVVIYGDELRGLIGKSAEEEERALAEGRQK
jgi:hypothetical protein